ncbi:RagB/SusD family nutrient uptake outer membrane protein [Flagellimonas onchidii]|uniref:RagB/SusD family nutrient uptake outer membrane protein n=1 Tax=Flagellimonas onchidii TaxID=2562684 RepID=UPI0010A61AFA|nr:RagB/SusD family nutrient uptake outer membrane protein [Allomuricauda onchidii]
MKKVIIKNSNRIVAILVSMVVLGCTKTLDLTPLDTISDASFWKTQSDFEKAANAFYASIPANNNGFIDLNADIASDFGQNTTSSGNGIVPQNDGGYDNAYTTIRGTSRLIENYELATDIQSETARYAGEARFFRAWAYLGLVGGYGDVPLITKVLDIDSEELQAPRSPRSEVMAFVMADLDWAIANLPEQNAISATETGRISKGAARALKVRAGLFEGTWAKFHGTGDPNAYLNAAISAAEEIISSGEYELYTADGTTESYRKLFLDGDESSEIILSRRYDEDLNVFSNITRWTNEGINSPTKQLADMYVCTDGLPISVSPLFEGYDT